MSKYDYDLICIGSGSAGGSAAFVAKKAGMSVAIVEEFKDRLGGHCPNYACVPTKALLKAAQVYKMAKESAQFGIHADNPRFDFQEVAKYREDVVSQLTGSRIEKNLHNAGIDLLWGRASFVSDHELDIAGKTYSAQNIIIGTGSKEFIPSIEGLNETGFWVSDNAMKLDTLPESVIIIGGGPIGTEFSQIFSGFDVKVTLLQRNDQILQREDKEVADYVRKDLESRGVKILVSCEIESAQKLGTRKAVNVKVQGKPQTFEAEELLVATGRRANFENLNLDKAGVKIAPGGKLELNEYLQTSVAHIWAAGDAAGNWQFTHTAAYEGDLVGRNICHRHDEAVNYDVVPRATFCDPEVASVGMTEAEAKTKGREYKIGKFSIGSLGRSLIDRDRRGFVKIIANAKDGIILGGHIVGSNAGQLIHEIALAMKAKTPVTTMGRMIHAYPTFSEAVAAAAEQFL